MSVSLRMQQVDAFNKRADLSAQFEETWRGGFLFKSRAQSWYECCDEHITRMRLAKQEWQCVAASERSSITAAVLEVMQLVQ